MKTSWKKAIKIIFAPKKFQEVSLKDLIPFKVIQKYWKIKEMPFGSGIRQDIY